MIALGTNDVANYGPDEYGPAIAELLAAVPADAPLVWVDTYLDELPGRVGGVQRRCCAPRSPSAGTPRVVDWAAIAAEEGVLSDGVHPSGYGVEQFAERVVGAVDDWMA